MITIKGYYENGHIFLDEDSPVISKTEVLITFLKDEPNTIFKKRGKPGALKGLVDISNDFNEPLEDLKG